MTRVLAYRTCGPPRVTCELARVTCDTWRLFQVLGMYHPRGYGGYQLEDAVFTPDGQEAFVTCVTPRQAHAMCNTLRSYFLGDNQGPPNITEL